MEPEQEVHGKIQFLKKKLVPLFILILFEAVAVILRLWLDNLFYLFDFSYIGVALSLGYTDHKIWGVLPENIVFLCF